MAKRASAEERKLAEVIQRLPFPEETKKTWAESIHKEGLNEIMIEDIQKGIAEFKEPVESEIGNRTRSINEINRLIRQWRLNSNLRTLKKQHRF
ncbi:MAG: hypothetical protein JEZ06_21900 [Anaerolineaceae bacterium]|nr:hypothetical protein [Anaerolineaceae bacterium]